MKKSKIVSHTSEELKKRESKTDWDAVANLTDEEIEASIASDPEESMLHDRLMKRAAVIRNKPRYIMCINNKGNEASLTLKRVYKVIPDEKAARRKMIKLIDDTGGEYLFPASCFVSVVLSVEAEHDFELVMA